MKKSGSESDRMKPRAMVISLAAVFAAVIFIFAFSSKIEPQLQPETKGSSSALPATQAAAASVSEADELAETAVSKTTEESGTTKAQPSKKAPETQAVFEKIKSGIKYVITVPEVTSVGDKIILSAVSSYAEAPAQEPEASWVNEGPVPATVRQTTESNSKAWQSEPAVPEETKETAKTETSLPATASPARPTVVLSVYEVAPALPEKYDVSERPALEEEILEKLNEKRAELGLNRLVMDEHLRETARYKSMHMIKHRYFGHESPEGEYSLHWLDRMNYEYGYWGENLAKKPIIVTQGFFEQWWNSPGHKVNMLGENYKKVGIGVVYSVDTAEFYATQIFTD